MPSKYILGSFVGILGIAFGLDYLLSTHKTFEDEKYKPPTVPKSELSLETDEKFQASPRTAGPR